VNFAKSLSKGPKSAKVFCYSDFTTDLFSSCLEVTVPTGYPFPDYTALIN